MLLEIRDGTASRDGQVVLSHFNFHIRGKEKIAIVGRNGAGKTTLLQILAGERELDSDEKHPEAGLVRSRSFTVAMVTQQPVKNPAQTVAELMQGASVKSDGNGSEWSAKQDKPESDKDAALNEEIRAAAVDDTGDNSAGTDAALRFRQAFTRLGFRMTDLDRRLGEFSGGEQTRIMLLAALLRKPDVLLLDEPTNHLDLTAVEWLEEALQRYVGAVVVVSHDRYFMDQVAEVIWEVSNGTIEEYPGNYSAYREEKTLRLARQRRAYAAQQEEIRREEALIERFRHKPRKAAFARARRTMLDRMEKVPRPEEDDAVIHTGDILPERPGSRVVLDCDHLLIGYDHPLREVSLRIRRGQKIGVFGPNGTGKSTFLKTIAGELPPFGGKSESCSDVGFSGHHPGCDLDPAVPNRVKTFNAVYSTTGAAEVAAPGHRFEGSGSLRLGEHIELAYYDQLSAQIRDERNVFDWFHDRFPAMRGEEVRSYLAGFLFRSGDLGKKVSVLSGGEKARLVLAELLAHKPNFLVLDEPTNNMDIPARETLESIFRTYKGTILFVSHDRYFLSRVAEGLLLFPADDKSALYFPGGYDRYKEQERRRAQGGNLSAIRSAEEQRLIESIRAVPEKEKRERPLSDRQANLDWRFRLNEEERVPAEEAYRAADEALRNPPETEGASDLWLDEKTQAQRRSAAEESCRQWTKTLLSWYDIWLETDAGKDNRTGY